MVPVAPTGFSVIIDGDKVSGVYPDALRELGTKAGCRFAYPNVPRVRISHMFLQSGEADFVQCHPPHIAAFAAPPALTIPAQPSIGK